MGVRPLFLRPLYSYVPYSYWTHTPLQPLYSVACNCSEQQAGWLFGLMLMEVLIRRPEQWFAKKDPEVAEGTVYWT